MYLVLAQLKAKSPSIQSRREMVCLQHFKFHQWNMQWLGSNISKRVKRISKKKISKKSDLATFCKQMTRMLQIPRARPFIPGMFTDTKLFLANNKNTIKLAQIREIIFTFTPEKCVKVKSITLSNSICLIFFATFLNLYAPYELLRLTFARHERLLAGYTSKMEKLWKQEWLSCLARPTGPHSRMHEEQSNSTKEPHGERTTVKKNCLQSVN